MKKKEKVKILVLIFIGVLIAMYFNLIPLKYDRIDRGGLNMVDIYNITTQGFISVAYKENSIDPEIKYNSYVAKPFLETITGAEVYVNPWEGIRLSEPTAVWLGTVDFYDSITKKYLEEVRVSITSKTKGFEKYAFLFEYSPSGLSKDDWVIVSKVSGGKLYYYDCELWKNEYGCMKLKGKTYYKTPENSGYICEVKEFSSPVELGKYTETCGTSNPDTRGIYLFDEDKKFVIKLDDQGNVDIVFAKEFAQIEENLGKKPSTEDITLEIQNLLLELMQKICNVHPLWCQK